MWKKEVGIFRGLLMLKLLLLIPGMKLLFECKSLFMLFGTWTRGRRLGFRKAEKAVLELKRRNHNLDQGNKFRSTYSPPRTFTFANSFS